jgi:hypothetical protein
MLSPHNVYLVAYGQTGQNWVGTLGLTQRSGLTVQCTLADYSQSVSSGMWTERTELGENTWFTCAIADYSHCYLVSC